MAESSIQVISTWPQGSATAVIYTTTLFETTSSTSGTDSSTSGTATSTATSTSKLESELGESQSIQSTSSSSLIVSITATQASSGDITGSATAATSSHKSSSGGQYGTGALAGGIVGAFVGGCLLAFLIAFLFFRKRRQREPSAEVTENPYRTPDNATKGPTAVSGQLLNHSTISYTTKDAFDTPDGFAATTFKIPSIPPPADDQTVSTKIESLFDQISLHIDNYYVRLDASPSIPAAKVDDIGHYDSSLLPGSLVSFLCKGKTQRAALTHALAYRLLEAIRPGSSSESLLPPCFRWAPSTTQLAPSERAAQDELEFSWRMIVSHLNSLSPSTSPTQRDETIDSLTRDFISTFSPYRNPEFSESQQIAHLKSVIKATSDLGTWLFSQPCAFRLDWASRATDRNQDQLIIFPSVVKLCDEQGRRLENIQKLVEERRMQM